MTACLSDLRLDEIVAGEAARDPHLSTCSRCATRETERLAERTAFRDSFGPLRAPSRAPRWVPIGATIAMAAVALIVVTTRPGMSVDDEVGTRTKGDPHGSSTRVVIAHAGRAVPLAGHARPGDTLAYLVTTTEPSYVAVLSRDASGHVSTYFPSTDRAELVPVGRDVELPLATRLDATQGREQLVIAVCRHPAAVAELVAAFDSDAPTGCTFERTSFNKLSAADPR
jgi:hypothetical protein